LSNATISFVRTSVVLLLLELLVVDAVLELTALVEAVWLVLVVEFRAASSVFSRSDNVEIAEMAIRSPF
jgi:hypothetical protein